MPPHRRVRREAQQVEGEGTAMRHSATCLVTGATSGIGRATAQALAGMGRSLVILGRDCSALEAVSAEISASTGNDAVEVFTQTSLPSIRSGIPPIASESTTTASTC